MKFTFAIAITATTTITAVVAQTAVARPWVEASSPYQKLVEGVDLPLQWYVPSIAKEGTQSSQAP